MQRYLQHAPPAAGEIVIFDRSWYNRAGVEYMLGFCSKRQRRRFLKLYLSSSCTSSMTASNSIKYWLEVSEPEQKPRLRPASRIRVRQWKLSPTDLCSRSRWFEYSQARDMMLDSHGHGVCALAHRPPRTI